MAPRAAAAAAVVPDPRTLCIDIGGTGLKVMVVSVSGAPLSERRIVATPKPGTPRAVSAALRTILPDPDVYDRLSAGFPGVVQDGVVRTAPNLDPSWAGFDLAAALRKATGKPTRVLNDAGVQGHGVIRGRGVEMCVTLGTGFGFSLFVDGRYVPNIELAHHPFHGGKTYEQLLGKKALARLGRRRWNAMLARAIDQLDHTFNYDALYIGGGNSANVSITLPRNVKRVDNVSGLLGGVKLWERS
ncbi:MAG TPA: ROK family protein [Anaeromyxobacteraceae bacterium]|nr:ROK family protein [Anaeromyxobacteraceae bacterium]